MHYNGKGVRAGLPGVQGLQTVPCFVKAALMLVCIKAAIF